MEAVIPWVKLLAVIEPFYLQGQRGRPPIGLARRLREQGKAAGRAFGEPPFPILKNRFRHRQVRYRGLAKNGHQLYTRFGLANVRIGARRARA